MSLSKSSLRIVLFLSPLGMTLAPRAMAAPVAAQTTQQGASSSHQLGLRFDCTHHFNRPKGSKQDCIEVSGTRINFTEKLGDDSSGSIIVDPFATTANHYDAAATRRLTPQIRDTPLAFIAGYNLTWFARPNMSVAVEDFRGSTNLGAASGLAKDGSLQDSPWGQTALVLGYSIPLWHAFDIRVALGNGEGEIARNIDAQQFVGLSFRISPKEGLDLKLGASYDGNNLGSAGYEWTYGDAMANTVMPNLGFETTRYSASIEMDGNLAAAKGLKATIGWQRTTAEDLDAQQDAIPVTLVVADVGALLVENTDKTKANVVTKDLFIVGASYRILARYAVGLNVQWRQVDTGDVDYFEGCSAIALLTCTQPGNKRSRLVETAVGAGMAVDLSKNVRLTLEYYRQSYDALYAYFHYTDPKGKATETTELFNARIAYRWD